MFEYKDKTWDAVCSYTRSQEKSELNIDMIVAFMNMYDNVSVCVYEVIKGIR